MSANIATRDRQEVARIIDEEALPFVRINEKAIAAGREPPFLNPRMEAIRYKLVKRADGTVSKVRRKEPLLGESGEISRYFTSGKTAHTDGERVLATARRGKYNDEDRLALLNPCTVETSELGDWRDLS